MKWARLFGRKALEKEPSAVFVRQIANQRFNFRVKILHADILRQVSLESGVGASRTGHYFMVQVRVATSR